MLTQEFRDAHPATPWKVIVGMRHFLVHGYYEVDAEEVWNVVEKECGSRSACYGPLPSLRSVICSSASLHSRRYPHGLRPALKETFLTNRCVHLFQLYLHRTLNRPYLHHSPSLIKRSLTSLCSRGVRFSVVGENKNNRTRNPFQPRFQFVCHCISRFLLLFFTLFSSTTHSCGYLFPLLPFNPAYTRSGEKENYTPYF